MIVRLQGTPESEFSLLPATIERLKRTNRTTDPGVGFSFVSVVVGEVGDGKGPRTGAAATHTIPRETPAFGTKHHQIKRDID